MYNETKNNNHSRIKKTTLVFQRVSKKLQFPQKRNAVRSEASLFLLGNKTYFDR